jgi:hypothetical protein
VPEVGAKIVVVTDNRRGRGAARQEPRRGALHDARQDLAAL